LSSAVLYVFLTIDTKSWAECFLPAAQCASVMEGVKAVYRVVLGDGWWCMAKGRALRGSAGVAVVCPARVGVG
jgi:hypothetical protein